MLDTTPVAAGRDHLLNPEPVKVHKPSKSGTGSALKLDLRLTPEYVDGKARQYVRSVEGGLFLELAAQVGQDDAGNATFDWGNPVMVKLGLPDITALLVGFRSRWAQRKLPASICKKLPDGTRSPNIISLFHRFNDDNAAIDLELKPEGSTVSISTKRAGQVKRAFIPLQLTEELLVERYLDLALTAFLTVGKR